MESFTQSEVESLLESELESLLESELESLLESEMESPGEIEIDPSVGVIFHPTPEEIILILNHKSWHPHFYVNAILENNLYEHEPDMLREVGDIQSDGKWYFFCLRNRLNSSGERFSRSTKTGYWKATGKVLPIKAKGTHEKIGTKRTLVFYKRFPGGYEERTNWVMHEYSAINNPQDLVVCKIKEKKDKKRCISTKNENKRAKKPRISADDVFQPEPPRSDAVENIYPEWHYHSVSNFDDHAIEDTLQVDPLPPLENLNVLNGSTWLDQTSFFTESPIFLEQGTPSSCVSTIENEVSNSSFGSKSQGEDDVEKLLGEGIGYTGGFCGGDSGDLSTEIFDAWVNEVFWNNTSEACLNYI